MSYAQEQTIETSGSPSGIGGWLKFFVVVNLYISPAFFILQSLLSLVGFAALAESHPRALPVGLVEIGIGGFLIWKWIEIARQLRDIAPGAVQTARSWLGKTLAIRLALVPVSFLSGLPAESLTVEAAKSVVLGLLGFFIWYSYFNSSKRVRATYPDWSEQ